MTNAAKQARRLERQRLWRAPCKLRILTEERVNQLAMLGLSPSPAAHGLASWQPAWPLLLMVLVMMAVLPLARIFSKSGGQPGD